MNLQIEKYQAQNATWPSTGRHILAQFTDEYIVVYQAYRPSIGHFAVENQFFGGDFSYTRMSWIKPNFLWMMYRSGWGLKQGQEVILAIKLKRAYFNSILEHAVAAKFDQSVFSSNEEWKTKLHASHVRLQWDPDHMPQGEKAQRKAIQLGLKNDFLLPFKGEGLVAIEDISQFVSEQREFALAGQYDRLYTPTESVYTPPPTLNINNIGIDIV